MIVTRKYLDRRTLLKGLGTSIALPFLDAMRPALAAPAPASSPLRLAFVYVPNGIVMKDWTPGQTGTAFDLPRILKPLEPHQSNLLVLSGLDHRNANPLGDGPGDHARAGACFLTGVHPRKTAGKDIAVGISADQIAAAEMGGATRLPSLELGCEDSRTVGSCDSGYSCAYTNSLAWRTEASPLPPVANPQTSPPIRRRGPAAWPGARAFSTWCRKIPAASRAAWDPPTAASWTSTCTPCARSSSASKPRRNRLPSAPGELSCPPSRVPAAFRSISPIT
jgi:hypothetical protein